MTVLEHLEGSIRDFIEAQGGELVDTDVVAADVAGDDLVDVDALRAELQRRAAPAPKSAKATTGRPLKWLNPSFAEVKRSEVWICIAGNGRRVLVHVTSHRRRRMRDRSWSRPRWYGVDILTGYEVRIMKVLDGSRR